jgi:hypothetical protein
MINVILPHALQFHLALSLPQSDTTAGAYVSGLHFALLEGADFDWPSRTGLCRRIDLKKNDEFGRAELTPPSCTTARLRSAGVSSGRRKSFPVSRISGLISMVSTTFPIGGSLAFSSIGIIDARGSHPSLSRGPCAKSPALEEVASKATRKRPTVARCHRPFFTTELFPCSSARASSDPVAWARTIG